MADCEKYKIKVYDNWDLYMHEKQYPYIGRVYAWAKRKEANLTTNMSKPEREELFEKIIPEWDKAILKLFNRDWHNIASLGNTSPHLHWHLIPRYKSEREFYGLKFIDPNPKGNYAPYPKMNIKEAILQQIKLDIQNII